MYIKSLKMLHQEGSMAYTVCAVNLALEGLARAVWLLFFPVNDG